MLRSEAERSRHVTELAEGGAAVKLVVAPARLVVTTLRLDEQVIAGGVVSITVTVWLHSAELPQSSVARQVRVASKSQPKCPAVLVVVLTMLINALPQVALAVGVAKLQLLSHATVIAVGQLIVGGKVALTTRMLPSTASFEMSQRRPCVSDGRFRVAKDP